MAHTGTDRTLSLDLCTAGLDEKSTAQSPAAEAEKGSV